MGVSLGPACDQSKEGGRSMSGSERSLGACNYIHLNKMIIIFIACLVFILSNSAFAQDVKISPRSFGEFIPDLYQPAAIIDDDDRRDEASYAREKGVDPAVIKKRFAPTGIIRCRGKDTGSGQVSYKRNVITTAAHVFIDYDSCEIKNKIEDCVFMTEMDGRNIVRNLKNMVGNGLIKKCPNQKRYDDWAVLRLSAPVPETVQPYKLADVEVQDNERVIQISARAGDFYSVNRRTGRREYPKAIGDCKVKKVYLWTPGPIYFSSNCDTGGGSSGGAVIRMQSEQPILLGILVSNDEPAQDEARATKGNRPNPNRGAYSEGKWASYHIPVTGEFRAAILRAGDSDD
ncbi:trypsin-like serine peptidase [Xanthobacter autotrophicus]|uniref:trypsin-like serine peptidase n=1 Tax=Xanthobacter autotrophicus TaxID=280 RepID=UPI0037297EB7